MKYLSYLFPVMVPSVVIQIYLNVLITFTEFIDVTEYFKCKDILPK